MGASIRVGKIFGIPIQVNYSWIFIFLLFTYVLATTFEDVDPGWPAAQRWSVAAFTAILFFLSVLAHGTLPQRRRHTQGDTRKGNNPLHLWRSFPVGPRGAPALYRVSGLRWLGPWPALYWVQPSLAFGTWLVTSTRLCPPSFSSWPPSTLAWACLTCCPDFRWTAGG